MKTKTPKARVMWAWPSHLNARTCPIWASRSKMHRGLTQAPVKVAVIPLDDVEAIVNRALDAFWISGPDLKIRDRDGIRAALTAAGIPCKRRARK